MTRPVRCALAALLLLVVALPGCSRREAPVREQLHVFGTLADIEVRDVPPAQAQAAIAAVSAQLTRFHREWHPWEPSDLTRINAALAAGKPAPAPPSVLELLQRSRSLSEASGGLFDPAVGGLIALWGFHTSEYPLTSPPPTEAQVRAWRQSRPRLTDLAIRSDQLVSRNRAVQLDFGAIAEGVAAEHVARTLAEHGVRNALITLGGDVYGLGDRDGQPWSISLRDPFGGILGSVDLRDREALFSTGNYNKFREAPSGARWSHILDPRTGFPAQGSAAVVVLHPDPVRADAAATALFAGGPSEFAPLAERMGLGCALMVTEENELLITVAMEARVTMLRDPVSLGAPVDTGPDCGGTTAIAAESPPDPVSTTP